MENLGIPDEYRPLVRHIDIETFGEELPENPTNKQLNGYVLDRIIQCRAVDRNLRDYLVEDFETFTGQNVASSLSGYLQAV
ncbi:hypothetical protein K3495_g10879 [Podosphaera aphanis]|nr:hypothetical protein K3495_g10879 [Podosphaera aphanis]